MTVIAGVGRLEREGLITELIGALGRGRSGVHLEIASDAGARYAIFRPGGGRHRVVDIDHAADVTDEFTTDGHLDVLNRAGMGRENVRRQLCLSPGDLVTRSRQEEYVLTLARVDQARLWDVVEKVRDRERYLSEAAQAAGSDVEDAVVFEEIERRHHALEQAQEAHEKVRHLSFVLGAGAALIGISAAMLAGFWAAVPFLLLAIIATTASILYWQRMEGARKDEERALASAGANSYLAFQINRVNGLLTNDHARRQMMRAAEDHRAALAEWRVLVGDIPINWAYEHAREIRSEAARLRDTIGVRNPMALTLPESDETTTELAHSLMQRLLTLKSIGAGGESFPMLIDDALSDIDPSSKPHLLEQLVKASADQQIIYLTEDEDVAAWARVEAMTGVLSMVEPAPARRPQLARRETGNIAV